MRCNLQTIRFLQFVHIDLYIRKKNAPTLLHSSTHCSCATKNKQRSRGVKSRACRGHRGQMQRLNSTPKQPVPFQTTNACATSSCRRHHLLKYQLLNMHAGSTENTCKLRARCRIGFLSVLCCHRGHRCALFRSVWCSF
jgi:hypothetical protein